MKSESNFTPKESVAAGERERLIAEIDAEIEHWYDGGKATYPHALLQRCRAALEASHAPVPREPTEAMLGNLADGRAKRHRRRLWLEMYDAAAGTTPEAVKP